METRRGAGAPGSASPSGARGRAPGSAPPSAFRSADHGSRPVISSHEPLPSTCLTPRTRLGLRNPSRERWGTGRKVQTRNPLHPNTFPAPVLKLRGRGSEHILKNGWNVISEACGNSPSPDPCYGLGPWAGRHTWAEPHTCACRNLHPWTSICLWPALLLLRPSPTEAQCLKTDMKKSRTQTSSVRSPTWLQLRKISKITIV